MNFEPFFPRGLAKGDAFCNRVDERNRLIANIKSGQHTLVISPRRYGKTSLVKYVIHESKCLFGEADLFIAVDAQRVEQQILAGVKLVIEQASTSIEQTLGIIRNYFKKISTKWTVGTQGVNIALVPEKNDNPATSIMEALKALEELLRKKKKRAVFFIDEVQEISEIAEGKGIEGALRHVAQETKYLSFIFSGSNRHLLAKMFSDKSRPLYKLCDRVILERINESHYKKHINKLSRRRWKSNFSEEAFDCLFNLTERHPFYINNICLRLWESNLKQPPTADDIQASWIKMLKDERQELMRELSILSNGYRKILIAIAEGYTKELTGKIFLKKVNMTGSSVAEALKILEQKDYIEKKENGEYCLIDPLIATALRHYFSMHL